jgi:hypothetical protein
MKRLLPFALLLVVPFVGVFAQTNPLETFQANFSSSNLQTKLEVLRASESQDAVEFGPLYGQALSFVVSNAEDLVDTPLLREIALFAVNRIDEGSYERAVGDLWRLFASYDETTARIQVANVLGRLAADNQQTIVNMNEWVMTRNNLARAGTDVDLQVFAAMIEALGVIGSGSSFPAVLDAILVQYPDFVNDEALAALDALDGEPLEMATADLRSRDIVDKRPAFSFFITSDYLSEADRAEFARVALADALASLPTDLSEQEEQRAIRFAAAQYLRDAEYGAATAELIRHFNETVLEWDRGRIPKTRVLEAIAALGATGEEDAARRLTDYLELLNTYSELDRPFDVQVVLATIGNLETLDFPLSYNTLFFTTLLQNYPDRVKDAARQAMEAVSQ